MVSEKTLKRFVAKVSIRGECWEWTGSRNRAGYGRVSFGGRTVMAHRLSYAMKHGRAPSDKLILHKCDNPSCVRPDHLFPGTHKDNMQDMVAKGRHRAVCNLAPRDIYGMRAWYAGGLSVERVAREYRLTKTQALEVLKTPFSHDPQTWRI